MNIVGFQVLSFDQVEKGRTSLLSALKFNFHSWVQISTEFTTDWTAASASSFTSYSEDADAISKDGNNCIAVKQRSQIVNVKQEE